MASVKRHLGRNLKEVRKHVMWVFEKRAFQAEEKANVKAVGNISNHWGKAERTVWPECVSEGVSGRKQRT